MFSKKFYHSFLFRLANDKVEWMESMNNVVKRWLVSSVNVHSFSITHLTIYFNLIYNWLYRKAIQGAYKWLLHITHSLSQRIHNNNNNKFLVGINLYRQIFCQIPTLENWLPLSLMSNFGKFQKHSVFILLLQTM